MNLPIIFPNLLASVFLEIVYIFDSVCNGKKSLPKFFNFFGESGRQSVLKVDAEIHIRELE